jgi:hypothetical protein
VVPEELNCPIYSKLCAVIYDERCTENKIFFVMYQHFGILYINSYLSDLNIHI